MTLLSDASRLFEFFVRIFDELIRDARKEGQFDSGIVDIRASTIELDGVPKVNPDAQACQQSCLPILVIELVLQKAHCVHFKGLHGHICPRD